MSTHTGGCRCGAVRFRAASGPTFVGICHCEDCRRASGAPFMVLIGFRTADVVFEADGSASFGEPPIRRRFCPTCGAPIAYEDERLAGEIYLAIGAMDEPARYTPQSHSYIGEALPFVHTGDGRPRYEATSVPRP